MGCDIHIYTERKSAEGYELVKGAKFIEGPDPFDWRSYGMFGFLAGVRNYSAVTPIADPRGLPRDVSTEVAEEYETWSRDAHSASWISVSELVAFDYGQVIEDRRVTVQMGPNHWDGGGTAEPGGGRPMTYREFLGHRFFDDLQKLSEAGADRIVFWFDN
ncbi:hypothetical protein [Sulfitobacter sp. 915]|uniref:hypothetical protein n=1 Tax=Sulfitobacter sp. 915 TaxID=3368558 RepID=UPI00374700C6